jgi:hypothetical protein
MIAALTQAFDDLRIAKVRNVLWHVVGWSLLCFIIVGGLLAWGIDGLDAKSWLSDDPGFLAAWSRRWSGCLPVSVTSC